MDKVKLNVDWDVQGYNREFSDVEALKEAIMKELDIEVAEVHIKKRATLASDSHDSENIKDSLSNNQNRR